MCMQYQAFLCSGSSRLAATIRLDQPKHPPDDRSGAPAQLVQGKVRQYPHTACEEFAMAVTFNPMNPMTWWTAPLGGSASVFAPTAKKTGPIAIDASASDPGIKVKTGADSITISGKTKGPENGKDIFGQVSSSTQYARGMEFSLDIDDAPTKDAFGKTDYTKKNERLFGLTTQPGWSAAECAERLADKVNHKGDFKAEVTNHENGSSTITFARR